MPGSAPAHPVPTAPRGQAPAVLTDHTDSLEQLAQLPLEEHGEVLASVHAELSRTLREAEG